LKLFAQGVYDWWEAIGVIQVLALKEFIPRKAENGEISWKD